MNMNRAVERLRSIWTAGMLAALAGTAFANTETVGGYEWTYSVLGTSTEEGGSDDNWTDAEITAVSPKPAGEVEIPARLGDWPVSAIKASAFKNCMDLVAVTLPTTVTNVGSSAFKGCTSLARVRILAPDVKFGTKPFAGCRKVEYVEIPARTAFSTLFPDAVAKLREAVVVGGSTNLVKNMFKGCTALTSVTLPDSVTAIGASAFADCTNLTAVTLPTTVTNIGSSAFKDCTSLARVRILAPEAKFGTKPFAGCPAVEFAEFPVVSAFSTLFPDAVTNLREAVAVDGSTKLVKNAFRGCAALMSVTLPDSLTTIGAGAFAGCANLKSMTFPKSVTSAGSHLFEDCSALTSLTVLGDDPSSVAQALRGAPENQDLVVRVPSSSDGWGGIDELKGVPVVFFVDPAVTYALEPLDPARIVGGLDAPRAISAMGCAMDGDGSIASVLELKIGRAGKAGSKISAVLTGIDGKRVAVGSATVDLSAGPTELVLRKRTSPRTLRIVLGRDEAGAAMFSGWWGNQVVRSAPVGGEPVKQAAFALPEGFARELQGGAVEASLLPEDEPVTMAGRKWTLAGAAKIAYAQDRATGEHLWTVNGGKADSPKTNLSGLKLQYTPKAGTFKGSFTAYAVKDGRLRKSPVKVTGVVVDGVGHGLATVKKVGVWPVLVR